MKGIICLLTILCIGGTITAKEVDLQYLYHRKKPQKTQIFKIPSKEKAFTGRDYCRIVLYPFLKRWIGKNEKYKSHPLFDACCKTMATILPQEKYPENITKAVELIKKNESDIISTIFLYCSNPQYFKTNEWIRRMRICRRKIDNNNFINYSLGFVLARLRKQPSPFLSMRSRAFRFAAKNTLNKRDSQHICRLIMKSIECSKGGEILRQTLAIKKENIWLRKTLLGVAHTGLAWKARGDGWGYKVTDKGWKGFGENLDKAEKNLTEAWEMHKDLPEPAVQMIRVAMGKGSVAERIAWFNRAIAGQATYNPAYGNIEFALRPRWGGTVELIAKLGDACYESGLYECKIPNRMLGLYKIASSECRGYFWQKVYRLPGVLEKFDKLLHNWCLIQSPANEANRSYYKVSLAMIHFYAGNYKKVNEMMNKFGVEKFISYEKYLMYYNPGFFPSWIRISEFMKYFNGPRGKQLIQAETSFINGNQVLALSLLEKLLADKEVKREERKFIIELWGRYALMASAYNYSDGCTSLNVASEKENLNVMKRLLQFGIDVNQRNKKGRPILISVAMGENPKLLSLLLKAGAKVDIRAKNNTTALMNALHKRKFKNVKLLVEAGADVNAKVGQYRIWDYVKHANKPEITEYMKAHGAK